MTHGSLSLTPSGEVACRVVSRVKTDGPFLVPTSYLLKTLHNAQTRLFPDTRAGARASAALCTATALLLVCAMLVWLAPAVSRAATLAPAPPMGWNSWDAYGLTINESEFKANASVLAGLRPFGWTYAVIDEGWYMEDPAGKQLETRKYQLDPHGLLVPALNRFPSAAGKILLLFVRFLLSALWAKGPTLGSKLSAD
jgi:hypothetical protein